MDQDILDKPFLPLDRLRILRYFSVYSVVITLALVSLYFMDIDLGFLGQNDPKVYPMVLSLHASITVVFLAMAFSSGQTHYDHLLAFFLLDITLIGALIYSSGTGTSLSYLMIVGVAVGNALLSGQKGLLISAWAAICLIFVENRFAIEGAPYNYFNAGTQGIIFFITALVIQALVKRLHLSVDINKLQADSLLSMEQLTKLVLKRLDTGVLVINSQQEIIFQNTAAQRLLGFPGPVRVLPDKLQHSLEEYKRFPKFKPNTFKSGPTTAKVQPMFAPLMPGTDRGIVIFIEDTNVVYQQAQRLKQVSLGKLAASIVREIKLPMQGIYNIAKKMSTNGEGSEHNELQKNIKGHAQHIERIINNVQNLSNTKATEYQKVDLGTWCSQTLKAIDKSILNGSRLELKVSRNAMDVYMDESQLKQVLINLVENGAYYAQQKSAQFGKVTVLVGRNKVTQQSIVEVQDNGYGVGLDDLDHIFEPFYSSEENKSGLGLYLAKQFCEMNMARLDYVASQEGARFRITFPTMAQVEKHLEKRDDFALRDRSQQAASA
ncbi:sensor histidine kinase [Bermanella sp. R86510]|uniref:sensor histidine kinase n=1 Tax=unclassified Bermanella TaxID=2627862 RepID=UPI0037C746A4